MTAPRTGDKITTAEQLDALPMGSVVLDSMNDAGIIAPGPMGSVIQYAETVPIGITKAVKNYSPFAVLYVHGEQPCRHCGSCDGPPSCPDCDHADRPSVTDSALAEVWDDELAARINAVRELHHRFGIYEPCLEPTGDDCPHDHFEDEDGHFVHGDELIRWACTACNGDDGDPLDYPCATITALEEQ